MMMAWFVFVGSFLVSAGLVVAVALVVTTPRGSHRTGSTSIRRADR